MTGRLGLGALGVVVAGYGAFRLLELGWSNLVATAVWLAGGVLVHDALLAPATIVVCAVAVLAIRSRAWRAAAAGGFLVLGTVTVTAVPVLGRFGAKPDNPTLLDRPYVAGWLAFASLVLAGSVVAGRLACRTEDRTRVRARLGVRPGTGSWTRRFSPGRQRARTVSAGLPRVLSNRPTTDDEQSDQRRDGLPDEAEQDDTS